MHSSFSVNFFLGHGIKETVGESKSITFENLIKRRQALWLMKSLHEVAMDFDCNYWFNVLKCLISLND